MRVLCLHGMGVNAHIFAQQTASFRALLQYDCDFVFLNGPIECEPAPGVENVYSDQSFRCWYDTPSTAKVAAAIKYVLSVINNRGPFDAVMGFSQGAALAASLILHHQLMSPPGADPLFRAAIFICSPVPFSSDLEYGVDARTYFGTPVRRPNPVRPGCPTTIPPYLICESRYLRGEERLQKEKQQKRVSGNFEKVLSPKHLSKESWYQMFHHTVDGVRISIPTAHVYGFRDQWRLHSRDLVQLCDEGTANVFEHEGGHEIPKDASEDICTLIETLFCDVDI